MTEIIIRQTQLNDLPQIIGLIAGDTLGEHREETSLPLPKCYADAFHNICNDKNNTLLVVSDHEKIVGCLQITLTQYLSHKGSIRATIENVRVAEDKRNMGIGSRLMNYAITYAKEKNCSIIELTTNKTRFDAHRFYKRLGFENTHEGMKLFI